MELGKFSVSLAVKDIDASLEFYKKLGFEVVDGGHQNKQFPDTDENKKWRMLKNGDALLGLFQGMFDTNTLTFNPADARAIQESLKSQGVSLLLEADETTTGPAALFLIDQH